MSPANWIALIIMLLLTMGLPFVLAGIFKIRLHVPLTMFFIAAGFYILNLIIQQPLLLVVHALGIKNQFLLLAVITPLIYAVCEETMRYFSFDTGKTMRTNHTANGALMAGIGHGGIESIFFTVSLLMTVIAAFTTPQAFKGSGVTAAQVLGGSWTFYILFALARLFAMTAHLGFATLTVLAYRRSLLFLPLAMLAHFLVDGTTFGIQYLTNNNEFWIMVVFAIWAIAALVLVLYVRRTKIAAPEIEESLENIEVFPRQTV